MAIKVSYPIRTIESYYTCANVCLTFGIMLDWMDYKAAEEASKKMKVPTKVIRTPGGHHMYIDDPEEFNRVVVDEMK